MEAKEKKMEVMEKINLFNDFFREYYLSKIMGNVREGKSRVTIELKDLINFNPGLAEELLDNPEDTIECAEDAINSLLDHKPPKKVRLRIRGDVPDSKVRIRDLRSTHLNKFITLEGTIEIKTDVVTTMISTKYECSFCGKEMNVIQRGDDLKEPYKCACGKKGAFKQVDRKVIDCFTLRLQELPSSVKYGSEMKTKSVLCKEDLTDTIIEEKLIEGLKVKINGIYKERAVIKDRKKQAQLITYFEANYITIMDESFYEVELNQKDIEEIKEFAKQPNLIENMYSNLFNGVHGYDKIKEALVLQAFGGVSNHNSIPPIRGDIHILLVGDPGENKSAFLNFASHFNPKNVLVVGKSVSAVGLSGAVIKDELTGSFVLKPGAIPLANNGIIFIDELDKMKEEDRDILHEPMEQQRISICKANLADRKMLARESFLVSMNPKNGYFNDYEPIFSQIDLPPTLVSRFDLVFVMRKNRVKDSKTREFEKDKAKIMMTRGRDNTQEELTKFHNFMKKYIAYARQNIHPKMDRFLEEEYLPEKFAGFDYEQKPDYAEDNKQLFPITPRHIWIIRRLAEARRRLFLQENVTQEDVDYAIEKIRGSLEEIATDKATGRIDNDWVTDGVSTKTKKLIFMFDSAFDSLVQDDGLVAEVELIIKLKSEGFEGREVEDMIEKKRKRGELLEPRRGFLKKVG